MSNSKYYSIANEYEKMRPEYPQELYNTLLKSAGVTLDSHLLEIGAGTGKATMPLAEKGFQIDCIEVESKMAEILKSKTLGYSNISVIVNNFETWERAASYKYDMIFSAQAFHWISESVKYKKCHELLRDGGKIGLIWYFSAIESQEYAEKLNSIFGKYNTGFACTGMQDCLSYFKRERASLKGTDYFSNVKEYIFEGTSGEQDSELFIKRFNTTSAYESLDDDTKMLVNAELEQEFKGMGNNVSSKVMYSLFIADRA